MEQIWGGIIPSLTLTGGRMANPFFSTDLVWDDDLNFEGAAIKLVSDTFTGNSWRVFLTAGAFPIEEIELEDKDKWLYGAQLGFEHRPFWGLKYKIAAAYYDFEKMRGEPFVNAETSNPGVDWSVPKSRQKGNSVFVLHPLPPIDPDQPIKYALASNFMEVNYTAMIDIDRFFPLHVIIWGDYVINTGYDNAKHLELRQIAEPTLTSVEEQNEGYQLGIKVGYPKARDFGEWNVFFTSKRVEADAVLDAFTDSDFHGGGTDAKGYTVGFEMGLYKNVWLKTRYISTDEIYDKPSPEYTRLAIDTLQIDINAEF
jgi:hypothetical protein